MTYNTSPSPQTRPERLAHWLFTTCGSWRNVMAFGLVAALTYISIRFNIELGKLNAVDQTSRELLPIGYALLDLVGLFLSGYIGVHARSPVRKAIAWLWFAFLLSLSLWAAASFTLSVDSRLENAELTSEISAKQAAIDTQAQKVAIWQNNLAGTTRYKTRYSGILTQEQNKHAELMRELSALQAQNTAPALAIYERVSPVLGLSTALLLTLVKLAWAAALTLSPIILMLLVASEFGLITRNADNPPPDSRPTGPFHGRKKNGENRPPWTNLTARLRQFSPYKTHPTTTAAMQNSAPERVQPSVRQAAPTAPVRVQLQPEPTGNSAKEAPNRYLEHRTCHTRKTHPRAPSDQRDAGTYGKAGHRYQDLKQHITMHPSFKPSQRAIRKYCRCNQNVATRYQQELVREGVIERQANGHYRVVGAKGMLRAVN